MEYGNANEERSEDTEYVSSTVPTIPAHVPTCTSTPTSIPAIPLHVLEKQWKIYIQNVNGLMTEHATKALDQIQSDTEQEKILLLNIFETWLNEQVTTKANIKNYNIFRSDRKDGIKGGVAIYVYKNLETKEIYKISHKKCEMIAIHIPEIQTINIAVYRPPKTEKQDFDIILNELEKILKSVEKSKQTIIISGDFNFPFVIWKRMESGGCMWDIKSISNATTKEKLQFKRFNDISEEHCLIQIIEEATRKENTLDLVYTNDIGIVSHIDVNTSDISDHNKIEITTTYRIKEEKINKKKQDVDNTLRSLNFHDERKFDWKQIIKLIKEMPWRKICKSGKAIEVIEYLLEKLYEICIEIVPKRNKEGKKKNIPKEIKNLLNRIKMLKRDKRRVYSKEKKKQIDNKICETEKQLIQTRQKNKLKKERQAIECMRENPKMLYSIKNKQKNRRNEIGPFKENDEIIHDTEVILEKQLLEFISQFSEKTDEINENIFQNEDPDDLNDIEVTEKEIIQAINDLDENSAAGPDGVPAILLKKVKEALALPLSLMLRKV